MDRTTLSRLLAHPFVLLAAGAAISGVVVPRLTQAWQDQRKNLETTRTLVERAVVAVTQIRSASQFAMVGAGSQTQEDLDAAYRDWLRDRTVISVLLDAHFHDEDINDRWLRCRALTTALYVQCGLKACSPDATARARRSYLREVHWGLAQPEPLDLSERVRIPDRDEGTEAPRGPTPSDLLSEVDEALAALASTVIMRGRKVGPRRRNRSRPIRLSRRRRGGAPETTPSTVESGHR